MILVGSVVGVFYRYGGNNLTNGLAFARLAGMALRALAHLRAYTQDQGWSLGWVTSERSGSGQSPDL